MSVDEEGLKEVIAKVRNIQNVSNLDLEEIVKGGLEEELIDAIEETTKGNAVKNMTKVDKVIMMSIAQNGVMLENIYKENKEKAVSVGLILLSGLATENWRMVSAAEAKLFNIIMQHTTMTDWVRAVFGGLLSSAEEAAEEADRQAGEKEALLEKVSKETRQCSEKDPCQPSWTLRERCQ